MNRKGYILCVILVTFLIYHKCHALDIMFFLVKIYKLMHSFARYSHAFHENCCTCFPI